MTFQLELSNNKIFKDAFSSIRKIIDEVIIECDSEGMRLNALDRSHITFVNMEFKAELFDEYLCDVPEKINVDTEDLNKVLKKCKTSDILKLTVDEGNVILIFEGDATRKFKIRLIDLEYESATPPMINYPVNLTIPTQVLKNAVTDMELFSDKLTFTVTPDYLIISTEGATGDAEVSYIHGEHVKQVYKSTFNIDRIKDMLEASNLSEQCELSLGEDIPLNLKLKLVTGDGELGFLLAPRLEEAD
ncbi:proliferating cell nuclear antigen (pcna) [uncultured Methanobrevibacter sp.]|uniref:proliferating cell nuclear antigen (pcna) n=1 Tax=uncultured Methanobrevibacter sp. TaxID=253161 RepID=UPI0025FB98F0|nr:proliferating cell nuclear antigen (pcna) [uncultured Methanobrevibacter sp.]